MCRSKTEFFFSFPPHIRLKDGRMDLNIRHSFTNVYTFITSHAYPLGILRDPHMLPFWSRLISEVLLKGVSQSIRLYTYYSSQMVPVYHPPLVRSLYLLACTSGSIPSQGCRVPRLLSGTPVSGLCIPPSSSVLGLVRPENLVDFVRPELGDPSTFGNFSEFVPSLL